MAAVLAVALLLLCGNVHSAEEEYLTGYVTQVKTGESNTSATAPVDSQALAPVISSPTGESGATHSAVLSALPLNEKSDVMPVDLARADDEQMINMTSSEAPETSPAGEAIPEEVDVAEAYDPSADVEAYGPGSSDAEAPAPDSDLEAPAPDSSDLEAPAPDSSDFEAPAPDSSDPEAPAPDSSEPEAPGADSAVAADGDQGEGTLVSDVQDTNYPNITGDEDNSYKEGYGVQTATVDEETQGESLSAYGEDSSEGTQGTLISDTDDTNYPNISADEDNSNSNGYGVLTATVGEETQGDSFSAYGEDSSDPEGTQGNLISDTDDTNYPNISADEDNSNRNGYGVRTATVGEEAQGDSFSAYGEDSSDPEGTQGTLISDTDDTNYPNISANEDNSNGDGVQTATVGEETQGESLSAYGEDSSEGTQGTLISDTDDTNYPNISADEDNSNRNGYGVRTATVGEETQGESLSAYGEDSSEGTQGTLVSDTDDTNYPNISADEDNSNRNGYGVRTATVGEETQGDSFSAYGEDSSGPEGTQGTLISDTEDTNYPTIPETQDYSGYGVAGEDAATTQDGAGSESPTSGVTLMQSRAYSPPRKPMASWSKGKCTYYGGMDAAGTMSGACGYGNLYASGYGAYTAALSSALFKNGMACGACYEVACSGNPKACKPGSVQVTVTNFCPPNPGQSANNGGWCNGANQHFDLSYPAFAKIANPKAGVVDLKYRRVPCKKKGGIRYTLNGNCNFNLVTITNVGGSGVVTAAYMKADGLAWAPLSRNWGANWQCSRNYCGKAIYIKIVTSDKKVSVSKLAGKDWAFGKTYIGQQVK